MGITKLNKIALNKDFLPSKKLSEIELNKIYEINDIKKAKTTYGIRFFVIIENKFTVFLPQRGWPSCCKKMKVSIWKLEKPVKMAVSLCSIWVDATT